MNNIYKSTPREMERQAFRGLSLINSYIFGASTEDPENAEFIARLIVERATGEQIGEVSVTPEKTLLGLDIGAHGIRMDLYIEEYKNKKMARVYDIEPNTYKTNDLPLRSRYSQALTDAKMLERGKSYRELPEYMSIWILPYDPFGENRMLYTVKNCVEENSQIVYNDGVMKLFLYVGGEIGGSEKLKDLLNYFANSEKENVKAPELMRLHHIVENVRGNRKAGDEYMTLQEYLEFELEEKLEARFDMVKEQVTQQVTQQSVYLLIETLRELQIPEEEILGKIMQKFNLSFEEAKSYLNSNQL